MISLKPTLICASLLLMANNAYANPSKIKELEARIKKLEKSANLMSSKQDLGSAIERKLSGDNRFNPAISMILNGSYANFTKDSNEIEGFVVGHEGERAKSGISIDQSELNISSNIDDKFYGSLTAKIVQEDGEDKIELEEAYVQTLKSYYGFSAKAGRFLATIGYLNEHHTHTDNFADRPLPYRAFLNKHFFDDGIEISYLFPTDFYFETGYALFRGDSFPAAGAEGNGSGTQSGYLRIGSEIAKNLEYRIGFSFLNSKTGSEARKDEDQNDVFAGDSDLAIADLKLSFSPVNNVKKQEVILQGEYFSRTEEGIINSVAGQKEETSGFYGEAIYKFAPKYRLGYRYSRLDKKNQEYTPEVNSFMFDYSNSEFSRIRVQYNADNAEAKTDNQYIFQYIMSIGAHPAHKF